MSSDDNELHLHPDHLANGIGAGSEQNANDKLIHNLKMLVQLAQSGKLRSFVGTGICSDEQRVSLHHFGDVSPLTTVGSVRLLSSSVEDVAYAMLAPSASDDG